VRVAMASTAMGRPYHRLEQLLEGAVVLAALATVSLSSSRSGAPRIHW
jgi:hypothetical protein